MVGTASSPAGFNVEIASPVTIGAVIARSPSRRKAWLP